MSERVNSTGLPRKDLLWALEQPRMVKLARQTDSCLLCRESRVNEAGLCRICYSLLDDREIALARRWLQGLA